MLQKEIMWSFFIAILMMMMASRVFFVTLHNWLTKRDYSYQIDDLCDLVIVVLIASWIKDFNYLKEPSGSDYESLGLDLTTPGEFYVYNMLELN